MPPTRTPTHVGLEQRVLARLKQLGLPIGTPIIVGFSGGGDSLALAALFSRLHRLVDLSFVLVHVDHRLRSESAYDAKQAEMLAESLQLPFAMHTLPEDSMTRFPGLGVEEAARRSRYEAFAVVAEAHRTDFVVTAHHRDDQAETVLLHLLRGSGLAGASAMAERSSLPVPWWDRSQRQITVQLWKPLLSESQSTLQAYLADTGLTPLIDPTNDTCDFTRNRLRHQVLPSLQAVNPNAAASLARYARIAAEEDRVLDDLASTLLDQSELGPSMLTVAQLTAVPEAIQRRLLRRWLQRAGHQGELSFERIEALLRLAQHGTGGTTIELGETWFATLNRGILTVKRTERMTTRSNERPD